MAHGKPDEDPRDCREDESGKQAQERIEHVMGKSPGRSETNQGGGHFLQRRKQARGEDAEMGGDFPHRSNHEERERSASDNPPTAFATRP